MIGFIEQRERERARKRDGEREKRGQDKLEREICPGRGHVRP